jgi:hypothetical protein
MPPEGFPPPAVGKLSTYWLIAEFPGGALLLLAPPPANATAGRAAQIRSDSAVALSEGRMLIVFIA